MYYGTASSRRHSKTLIGIKMKCYVQDKAVRRTRCIASSSDAAVAPHCSEGNGEPGPAGAGGGGAPANGPAAAS